MLIVFALITFTASRIARADQNDDRCRFAVLAARVPPKVSLKLVCEKPFQMIEGEDVVTVDCRKYCKARGLKGEK